MRSGVAFGSPTSWLTLRRAPSHIETATPYRWSAGRAILGVRGSVSRFTWRLGDTRMYTKDGDSYFIVDSPTRC